MKVHSTVRIDWNQAGHAQNLARGVGTVARLVQFLLFDCFVSINYGLVLER